MVANPIGGHLAPHPGVGNGLLPPERQHSSFIASILAHLIGARGLLAQMVAPGGLHGEIGQVIRGFGPEGPVVAHPGSPVAGGFVGQSGLPAAVDGFPPANGLPTHVPAPQLAPGTYGGAYAALGLRTSDPYTAAQLWESRHPYAMSHGNTPHWVTQALLAAIHGSQPAASAAPAPPRPVNQPI